MQRRAPLIRPIVPLVVGLALFTAACGGGDDSDGDAGDSTAVTDTDSGDDGREGGGDAADGTVAATGTLTVSGALENALDEADDAVTFRAGGGCFDGSFQMSVKVDVDGRTVYDVIVPDLAGIDGSASGEFPTDVEFLYYDPELAAFEAEEFTGVGTVTVVEQRPDDRAFEYEVAGSFESQDDPSRAVDVDFGYTAPIICS